MNPVDGWDSTKDFDSRSFGQSSLTTLLHYKSKGTITTMIGRGYFPEPDRRDWYTDTPRWSAEAIALWLIQRPQYLARVTDEDMLALVSEVRRKL